MRKILLLSCILAAMGLQSCSDWLDINHTPNNASATNITMDLLLPAALYNVPYYIQSDIDNFMLGQYLTKSGEFGTTSALLTGLVMPQSVGGWWSQYYQMNTNLRAIEEKAIEANHPAFQGAAITLMAYNYQMLIDMFGNIAYSQAGKPQEFTNPAYDPAPEIYADLILRMDEAIACFEKAIHDKTDLASFKTADIMTKGDLDAWLRYANSQKLRFLMRISNVQDVKTQVAALEGKCLKIDENLNVQPGFYVATDKMNRFYSTFGYNNLENEVSNHKWYVPTTALIDMLRDNNDPRLRVYADPRATLGNPPDGIADYKKYGLDQNYYVGVPYGQMAPPGGTYTCKIGLGILAGGSSKAEGAKMPMTVITGAEVGFFFAEAAIRGMIPGGDAKAKEYYEAAVTSAMKRHEKALKDKGFPAKGVAPAITGSAAEAAKEFLAQDNDFVNWAKMGSNERKLEAICSQKWLSLYAYNPFEGWTEQRRTDLPKLHSSIIGQESLLISRFPYPQTERNLNWGSVSAQGEIDIYHSLIFWDLKNEVVPRTEPYL